MPDPIDYRDPHVRDRSPRARARRVVLSGAGLLLVSSFLMLLPLLLLPRGDLAKYTAVIALLGALLGMGFVVNGAVDWWRGR
jgi:heme/copper-type cytochrome/quinol oxidase subunit 3